MQAALIVLAIMAGSNPVEQGSYSMTAYNAERSFAATLSFPPQLPWAAKRQRGTLSLQNVSADSRYVFDIMWPNVVVHFENVGRGLPGQFLQVAPPTSLTQYMTCLSGGQSLGGFVFPTGGWDFCCASNSKYKVNIVYDDSSLWPEQMATQRVGRIVFPLTMEVTQEYLSFQSRKPDKNEAARPVGSGFLCGNMSHKRDCRLVRAAKDR
jgi:hypothetical protein